MTKQNKINQILTTIVCLIPVIAGIVLYNKLPAQIVTHWDASGQPNGWSSRFVGAIVLPGILCIVNVFFPFILKLDPKNKNLSPKIVGLLQWIIPIVALFGSGVTLASALNMNVKIEFYAPIFVGLIFIIIGNYLPKMSQSYTVGIKLPWTLHDEDNWDRTHRFSGFLWVVCGFLFIIIGFLHVPSIVFIILALVMVLVPTIYSYSLYAKKGK